MGIGYYSGEDPGSVQLTFFSSQDDPYKAVFLLSWRTTSPTQALALARKAICDVFPLWRLLGDWLRLVSMAQGMVSSRKFAGRSRKSELDPRNGRQYEKKSRNRHGDIVYPQEIIAMG